MKLQSFSKIAKIFGVTGPTFGSQMSEGLVGRREALAGKFSQMKTDVFVWIIDYFGKTQRNQLLGWLFTIQSTIQHFLRGKEHANQRLSSIQYTDNRLKNAPT